jgi:hypothetical protein
MQTNISIKYIITILISVIIGGAATYGFFLNKNNLEQITNESVSHLQENKKTSIWQVTKEDRSEDGSNNWDEEIALSKVTPTPKEGIQVTEANKEQLAERLKVWGDSDGMSGGDILLVQYNLFKKYKEGYIQSCGSGDGGEYWYNVSDAQYTVKGFDSPSGDMIPMRIVEHTMNPDGTPWSNRSIEKDGFDTSIWCDTVYLAPNNPWGLGGINKYNFK